MGLGEQVFVDIETPYSGASDNEVRRNIRYARACMRDCIKKDEVPFASHLLYTQPGILDDNNPHERETGILAGKLLITKLEARTVVYTDLGISKGMRQGIQMAEELGRKIEYRTLGDDWESKMSEIEAQHSHNSVW